MLFVSPVTVPPFVMAGPPELSTFSEPMVRFDVLASVLSMLFPAFVMSSVPSGVPPVGSTPSVLMSLRLGGNGMHCGHE